MTSTEPGPLFMLVSAGADADLRAAVDAGRAPCPEYLVLERRHGVRLLDWTMLRTAPTRRSPLTTLRQIAASVSVFRAAGAVISDGEHIGFPLALTLRLMRIRCAHVMIGHRLLTARKRALFRALAVHRGLDRILIHSPDLRAAVISRLHVDASLVRVVPYGVDTHYWTPQGVDEEPLVFAPGREHRDFATLAAALDRTGTRVLVTGTSVHSPSADRTIPAAWPANFQLRRLNRPDLRDTYARASVVVVPLLATNFAAGVTTVLEAMAMGKAVVVSDTDGLRGLFRDGEDAVIVPVGDYVRMRAAVLHLLASPDERRRLGQRARNVVVERYGVGLYADELARQMRDAQRGRR